MHINWRYKMKCHYDDINEQLLDTYSHPYDQVTLEDWRHLSDDVWKSEKIEKPSAAGKNNRRLLDHSHCSGSRSFVAKMTIPRMVALRTRNFLKCMGTHTNKNKEWISDIYSGKHAEMLQVREKCTQSGVQMTLEKMSTQVLRKRKKYTLGFGVGPKPSSSSTASSVVSCARDKELVNIKVDREKMQTEREEEKRAREVEMETIRMEREEEKKAHEAEMGKMELEGEEARREHEEEKREQEVERVVQRMQGNKQILDLSIMVGTTL